MREVPGAVTIEHEWSACPLPSAWSAGGAGATTGVSIGEGRSSVVEFRVVTEDELRPVLDVLNSLDGPVPYDEFPAVFERLGWEKQRRRGGVTSLPVSLRLVSVGELDGEISYIEFCISDTLPDSNAESQQIVKAAFPEAVRVVSACLGAEPSGTPWVSPGARWELEGGRQFNLLRGEDTIDVQYWSKQMADLERHERSHGVDPAHNLDDRE